MTHQSASTVNETPGAAVQRTLRRAFFPTEELYFEVHRVCLKNKRKINEEKTESAVAVATGVEPRQKKNTDSHMGMPCAVLSGEGRGVGEGIGRAAHIYGPFSRSQPDL